MLHNKQGPQVAQFKQEQNLINQNSRDKFNFLIQFSHVLIMVSV